jgi:dihydroneopterin aldolase
MSVDHLRLEDVQCRCHLGVPSWERKKRQRIFFTVEVELPLAKAGASDKLTDSLDYHGLEVALRTCAEEKPRKLIEALAKDLVDKALTFDRRIRAVRLAVKKKPSVMPKTGGVVVEIYRKRK